VGQCRSRLATSLLEVGGEVEVADGDGVRVAGDVLVAQGVLLKPDRLVAVAELVLEVG
jgi:hypothetical protein